MLGINLEENTYCAIKMMKKNEVNSVLKLQKFLNEVQLLSEAKHKNIIELLYVNIDADYSD
jgi:serine/threonine protein kinase